MITKKGKGYLPAERHPARFHGTEPFDVETGLPLKKRTKANYTDVFASAICKLGKASQTLVTVTAAMADGTGLKQFRERFSERCFDVGIAEEHAVTFAAGLAAAGLKPVVAIYSSFLQRAYDQILHDVCIQDLPVVFAVDRAGLVGSDGETHQGIFDLSFLSSIPNMTVMAPKNKWELSDMLKFAAEFPSPIAIRYPRGEAYDGLRDFRAPIAYGKSEVLKEGGEIVLYALGSMVKTAEAVCSRLTEQGCSAALVNARFAKPLDTALLKTLAKGCRVFVTLEENVRSGGFGEHVTEFLCDEGASCRIVRIAIPDDYVEHGNVDILRRELKLDEDAIYERVMLEYRELGLGER